MIDCPHYTIHQHHTSIPVEIQQLGQFRVLVVLNGEGELHALDFRRSYNLEQPG
ncbi:MAG: hypothetical protein R3C11_19200 [Planctomycetaceae bacterium]